MESLREQERLAMFQAQIVEEERARLLREHAPKLIGYLPRVRYIILTPRRG